jgi:hypothetical protein
MVRHNGNGFELAGQGSVDGQPVISGVGCLGASIPIDDYVDPAYMRVLFSEIYQPEPCNVPTPI